MNMTTEVKICPGCNEPFTPLRSASTCSERCKKRVQRQKKKGNSSKPIKKEVPKSTVPTSGTELTVPKTLGTFVPEKTLSTMQFKLDHLEKKVEGLAENKEKKLPEAEQIKEDIIGYLERNKVKGFNVGDPKFRESPIEKIAFIIKELYD